MLFIYILFLKGQGTLFILRRNWGLYFRANFLEHACIKGCICLCVFQLPAKKLMYKIAHKKWYESVRSWLYNIDCYWSNCKKVEKILSEKLLWTSLLKCGITQMFIDVKLWEKHFLGAIVLGRISCYDCFVCIILILVANSIIPLSKNIEMVR